MVSSRTQFGKTLTKKEKIMEDIKETYQIPKFNLGYLMERVDKLNRRAEKMGLGPIKVETIREYDKEIKRKIDPYFIRMAEIQIEGKAPKFNGWTFIATIAHEKAASNLIKAIPGIELDHKYRDAAPDCDHCKSKRWRIKTYICQHDDGREVQVGSTCIKDFLGHTSPESIAWQCEMLGAIQEMFREMGEYDGMAPRGEMRVSMKRLLVMSACAVHEYGWMSRAKASADPYDPKPATADYVSEYLFPTPRTVVPHPDAEDAKLAYGALQWARNLRPRGDGTFSDYEYNLSVITKEKFISPSELGLAVSMVGVYKINKDKAKQMKVKRSNKYFGEIKKRYELDLKVVSISGFESFYGYTTIYKMACPEGNAFSWFSTSNKVDLDEGETYHVKATVKDHKEWQGRKETMVTRLSVLE